MRICLISRKVNLTGGIARYVYELCRYLVSSGHEVDLFVSHYSAPEVEGLRIHSVPMINGSFFEGMKLHALAKLLQVVSFSLASLFVVRSGDYDIVHVQGDTLVMPDVKTAHSCHLHWIDMARREASTFTEKLKKSLLNPLHMVITFIELKDFRNSTSVLAVSERTAGEVAESYGIDRSKITAIPNGVDTELFHPRNRDRWRSTVRGEYGIGDDEKVVIFVAAEFRRKGLGMLLKALQRLEDPGHRETLKQQEDSGHRESVQQQEDSGQVDAPSTVLMVVGGDRSDPFEEEIDRSGMKTRVVFTDHLQHVERAFAAADIFVLPSVYEPFGLVLTEAMACGLPVVTTDRVGGAALIEDGITGFIIDGDDIEGGLTRVLGLLLADSARVREVGAAGRAVVEAYTWSDVGRMTENIYKKTVDSTKNS